MRLCPSSQVDADMFALNTLSLMAVTKAALKGMLRRRSGRVVVVRLRPNRTLSLQISARRLTSCRGHARVWALACDWLSAVLYGLRWRFGR